MGVICLTDEMKSKALRLLRAAAGRYDKICEAWYAHAGEELDLQLFLDMAEDDCLTYLGTQELPPVVTATTLAKLAFVHQNPPHPRQTLPMCRCSRCAASCNPRPRHTKIGIAP